MADSVGSLTGLDGDVVIIGRPAAKPTRIRGITNAGRNIVLINAIANDLTFVDGTVYLYNSKVLSSTGVRGGIK